MQTSLRHPPKRFGPGGAGGNGRRLLLLAVLAPALWLLSMFPATRHFLHPAPEFQPAAILAPPAAACPVLPDAAAAECFQEQQSQTQQNRAQQECWEQPPGSASAALRTAGENFFGNRTRTSGSFPDRHGIILPIRAGPVPLV
ncbi:MAG: hypothetical protein AB7F32_04810 [Victivallaceae bacterium]